jgi:hypothetical protein
VVDFMPVGPVRHSHAVVRRVKGVRGRFRFRLTCAPRFDYARAQHTVDVREHGAILEGAGVRLTLHGVEGLQQQGQDVTATRTVHANESFGVILENASETPPRPVSFDELWQLFEGTARF